MKTFSQTFVSEIDCSLTTNRMQWFVWNWSISKTHDPHVSIEKQKRIRHLNIHHTWAYDQANSFVVVLPSACLAAVFAEVILRFSRRHFCLAYFVLARCCLVHVLHPQAPLRPCYLRFLKSLPVYRTTHRTLTRESPWKDRSRSVLQAAVFEALWARKPYCIACYTSYGLTVSCALVNTHSQSWHMLSMHSILVSVAAGGPLTLDSQLRREGPFPAVPPFF